MMQITAIGLDIAKTLFQVHGVDAEGQVVVRRRLARRRVLAFFENLAPCLVGIEACSTSHYWARELIARGHEVRLLPAQYVRPYVKRGKNDAADAEAICEAVTRPTMCFVAVKTPEQQSVMMLHRVRLMLNRQSTQLSNSIRSHLSEFGIIAPLGRRGIDQLLAVIADERDLRVPAEARVCLRMLAAQLVVVKEQILETDRRVRASARETELGRRLMEVPGVGPLLASAFIATIADPAAFKTGRDLAAWIGLVPKQNSSGGKERLGSITKAGNSHRYRCGFGGGEPGELSLHKRSIRSSLPAGQAIVLFNSRSSISPMATSTTNLASWAGSRGRFLPFDVLGIVDGSCPN